MLFQESIVADLKLSVLKQHLVEFAFELKSQLDLFLVVLVVLHVLVFKL